MYDLYDFNNWQARILFLLCCRREISFQQYLYLIVIDSGHKIGGSK